MFHPNPQMKFLKIKFLNSHTHQFRVELSIHSRIERMKIPTLEECFVEICDGIDELGAAVSVRRHFSLESTEVILHRLRYLQQTQAHNLPQLLYDGEFATTGGEKI